MTGEVERAVAAVLADLDARCARAQKELNAQADLSRGAEVVRLSAKAMGVALVRDYLRTAQGDLAAALAPLLAAERARALDEAADDWPREMNAETLRREMNTFGLRDIPARYTPRDWLRERADRERGEATT